MYVLPPGKRGFFFSLGPQRPSGEKEREGLLLRTNAKLRAYRLTHVLSKITPTQRIIDLFIAMSLLVFQIEMIRQRLRACLSPI